VLGGRLSPGVETAVLPGVTGVAAWLGHRAAVRPRPGTPRVARVAGVAANERLVDTVPPGGPAARLLLGAAVPPATGVVALGVPAGVSRCHAFPSPPPASPRTIRRKRGNRSATERSAPCSLGW